MNEDLPRLILNGYKSDESDLKLRETLKQSASLVICRGGPIRFKNEKLFN